MDYSHSIIGLCIPHAVHIDTSFKSPPNLEPVSSSNFIEPGSSFNPHFFGPYINLISSANVYESSYNHIHLPVGREFSENSTYVTQATASAKIKPYIGSQFNSILKSCVQNDETFFVFTFPSQFSALALCLPATAQTPKSEYMSFDAAQPVLHGFSDALPADLGKSPDAAAWSTWIKTQDSSIRQRLVLGEEDTLTKILRWGRHLYQGVPD